MTLYHFGNCLALTYVPCYFIYKYSNLSEYGAYWKCVHAGLIYMVTQICKMLLLATFFPESSVGSYNNYDVIGEFLKHTLDSIDLIGFYFTMSTTPGRGHVKILTASIGWATAEILFTRVVLLWVGARGTEFDWKYIITSIDSNINLVNHISTCALVWMLTRFDLKEAFFRMVVCLLVISAYRPFTIELLKYSFMLNEWTGLCLKASITALSSLITLNLYIQLTEQAGI